MNYIELLKQATERTGSIVSVGLDPVYGKIPLGENVEESIVKFFKDQIEAFVTEDCLPGAFKPQSADYEQYGIEGLKALKRVVEIAKKTGIPVILDAKRGDIGRTSEAYARAIYETWGFDCTTIAPYMGSDSVGPFIEYSEKGKGVYILCRTSNKGAVDLQDLKIDGMPVYKKTAENIVKWAKSGTGAVVGATYPGELEEIAKIFVQSGKEIPLLIPGVGSQGGSAKEVLQKLKEAGYDLSICRIHSSSAINFAYLKEGTNDYAGAAVRALKQLNEEINYKPNN
jgi:orotidine-5'-phosphate decarboxylase